MILAGSQMCLLHVIRLTPEWKQAPTAVKHLSAKLCKTTKSEESNNDLDLKCTLNWVLRELS